VHLNSFRMRPNQKTLRNYHRPALSGLKVYLDREFAGQQDVVEALPVLDIPSPKHNVNAKLK